MLADELQGVLHCQVERDRPLGPLSTLGVGGRAECYLEPSGLEDLQRLYVLSGQMRFPVHVLGGGSNVVFPDGLLRGVLLSARRWNAVSWGMGPENPDGSFHAEAQSGCRLASLLESALKRGSGDLSFALGIPGTLGGAIAGNAGTGGRSVAGLLEEITAIEPDGSLRKWRRGEFSFAYRSFPLAREGRFFLSCRMAFSPAPAEDVKAELDRFRSLRASQPAGGRSAGCSFKNPEGDSAGRLLDRCGCKGLEAGDAVVSDQHANFILNRGRATSADVAALMRLCRERVFEATGILLEPEVKFVGWEFPVEDH